MNELLLVDQIRLFKWRGCRKESWLTVELDEWDEFRCNHKWTALTFNGRTCIFNATVVYSLMPCSSRDVTHVIPNVGGVDAVSTCFGLIVPNGDEDFSLADLMRAAHLPVVEIEPGGMTVVNSGGGFKWIWKK